MAPVVSSQFPTTFQFDIFSPPPAEAIMDFSQCPGGIGGDPGLPGGAPTCDNADETAKLAFGYLFAFDDVDGDGTFVMAEEGLGGADRFIGVSWSHLLVYVETKPLSGGNMEQEGFLFTDYSEVTPGFHLGVGVCTGQTFDLIDILGPGAQVDITLIPPSGVFPDQPDEGCLNIS